MNAPRVARAVPARLLPIVASALFSLVAFVALFGVFARTARAVDCFVPGGFATIQGAIDDVACTTIHVAAGTYTENLSINRDVSIIGAGAGSTIVDGGALDRVVTISGGAVVISGTQMRNGHLATTAHAGGGISNYGSLHVVNSIVRNNIVTGTAYGGGIANGGTLTLTNVLVRDNRVSDGIVRGGGLYNTGTAWVLEGTVIRDNALEASQTFGGGIYNSGVMTMAGSVVRNNVVTASIGYGSGLQNDGVMVLDGATISLNSIVATVGYGAGLYNGNVMTMTGSVVGQNEAPDLGGGLFNVGSLTILESVLRQNEANGGGGLYNSGALTLSGSRVISNTAMDGGGIQGGNPMTVTHSTVLSNTASDDGGGIYSSSMLLLQDSIVAYNRAVNDGAGLYTWDADRLIDSTLAHNTNTDGDGAGIYQVNGSHITATNVTISHNRSEGLAALGGAWYSDGELSTAELSNTTIVSNSVAGAGNSGGLYLSSGVTVTLQNSIVAHNSTVNCAGDTAPLSGGHNLESANDCGLSGADDQTGVDPLLGALALNGGATPNHALLPGSPAVDEGDTGLCPATDQRGVSRASGVACDVGSYEAVQVAAADTAHPEGDAGASQALVTVTLSVASPITEQVDFATSAGTATAGVDYENAGGTLIFAPGEVQATAPVTVYGDTVDETDESFVVTLSDSTGAHILDNQATGLIMDDDGPQMAITDATVVESDAGGAIFTVTLSASSPQTVAVDYVTVDGTAQAGSDYTATSGTLSFAPGETVQTITVTVVDDQVPEADETFTVSLNHASGGTIGDATGQGLIENDDQVLWLPLIRR